MKPPKPAQIPLADAWMSPSSRHAKKCPAFDTNGRAPGKSLSLGYFKMKKFGYLMLGLFVAALTSANGQTITWRAVDNPHVVNGTFTVAAGQTLIMEAGVVVQIQANSILQVDGQAFANGTAANRVTITGATNYSSIVDVRGTFNGGFMNVRAQVRPDTNGVLLFADSIFSSFGTVFNGAILQQNGRAPYIQFDRCTFQGDGSNQSASLYVAYVTVVLRNTSFNNGSYCNVYPAYLLLDQVNSDHSSDAGLTLGSDSDLYLNNISVTNAARAGLRLAGDTRNGTNVLVGSNVVLQGNDYPVHLTIAGLYPASNVPATGNTNNLIHVSEFAGTGGYWPKFAIPYYNDASPLTVSAGLHIMPGVTVKMAPFSYINDIGFGDGMRAFGTKDQPIVFERANPAQAWYDLHADRTEGGRLRHTIVRGNTDGVNGGEWRLENCIFQNNGIGTSGGAFVSGSQYLGNTIGHNANGGSLNGGTNPNSFEGNGTGVNYSPDARNSWWGSPTGPRVSDNPSGSGDSINDIRTPYRPFLTSRPSYADAPPEVVLLRPSFQLDPGSKVTLRWNATDDAGIVSQKILFSPVGNYPGSFTTVATLPANQRSYEWTVPNIGFTVNGNNAFIKVVATDTTGKESFDEAEIVIPTNDIAGSINFGVSAGQTFAPGEFVPTVYTKQGIDPYLTEVEFYLEDVNGETRKMLGRGREGLPFFSTDTARFVVSYGDTTNHRKYWYSPLFKIRPDSRLGDAPPVVTLTSPQAGQPIPPNSIVPVTWNASDDEGLRSFDIIASYDSGRTWQPVVRDLPGTARSYDWLTAPGTGYPAGVRVKVIAKDWRFQMASDGNDQVRAVSRKVHGSAGTFDIDLPLTGNPGVECRGGGSEGNYQIVVNFPATVSATNPRVTSGTATVTSINSNGSQVTVDLTGVTNAQRVTLVFSASENGAPAADVTIPMTVLYCDTNGNNVVNASDIGQSKASTGQIVTAANFRNDVNANGTINASDTAAVKSQAGASIP